MNSENLILRSEIHSPLPTKGDYLDIADFDNNNINIYEDFVSLATSEQIADFETTKIYDDTLEKYCTYNGRSYKYINASASMGNLPTDTNFFIEIFPTDLAHQKNRDTILDEGGTDEVSASEIRAFIDAGLTSTTNLSISGHTSNSLVIESSTGTDVTLLEATRVVAGLLTASNKVKLDNISGVNTGDQTLASLNAENVDNKVNDFTTINDVLYPTTEAVDAYITSQVPTLVDASLTGVELQANKDTSNGYVGTTLFKINFKNALNSFTSYLKNSNTASRIYSFQDRNGIIADDTDIDGRVAINSPIIASTKTKITYDEKGLVTSGADATTADIADSTNKRYVTDAQLTSLGSISGTNTGDETTATIKTKLGVATTSTDGYLTSTGWNTFNNKQNALGFTAENVANKQTDLTASATKYPTVNAVNTGLSTKQDTLVSGTSIKTINSTSLLGSGDIDTISPRVQSVTSSATVTPVSTNDLVKITAQAVGLTLANPTGAFSEGQALMIRIKDNGTAQTIAFGTNYRAIGVTLPTTTVISKTLYLGVIYNSTDGKWDIVGLNQQA